MQHGDRNQLLSIWNPFVIIFSLTAIPSLIFLLVHCTSLASTLVSSHWMLWLDCLTWTASTLLLCHRSSLHVCVHSSTVLVFSPSLLHVHVHMYVFFATFTCRRIKTSISDHSLRQSTYSGIYQEQPRSQGSVSFRGGGALGFPPPLVTSFPPLKY